MSISALEPTRHSLRSYVAPAIARGSLRALAINNMTKHLNDREGKDQWMNHSPIWHR
jgi:hypothetical protein